MFESDWKRRLRAFLDNQSTPVTVREITAEALSLDTGKLNSADATAIVDVIRAAGWRKRVLWFPPEVAA